MLGDLKQTQRRSILSRIIFINLPAKDLAVATRFYEAIGCKKNEQFSDHKASSMVWSDAITFQLLSREYFATFTQKQVADAHNTCDVLLALTRDSREDVDTITEAAAAAGGKADVRDRMDMEWLYNRAFEDIDGHAFEAVWMDMNAASEMTDEQANKSTNCQAPNVRPQNTRARQSR